MAAVAAVAAKARNDRRPSVAAVGIGEVESPDGVEVCVIMVSPLRAVVNHAGMAELRFGHDTVRVPPAATVVSGARRLFCTPVASDTNSKRQRGRNGKRPACDF
jgi:hypothetical protein